jgi:hypothetical protein
MADIAMKRGGRIKLTTATAGNNGHNAIYPEDVAGFHGWSHVGFTKRNFGKRDQLEEYPKILEMRVNVWTLIYIQRRTLYMYCIQWSVSGEPQLEVAHRG